ncbi:unnamed protein product [Lasius platythorax]|uniref:Cytochrome P450 n=1 Tax=Lasius platythorax TaxID=488582 RepID=A0AAV2NJH4_9HYME
MSPLLFVILALLVAYKLYRFVYEKPSNTLPGLIRIPVAGSYWLFLRRNYKYVHLTIMRRS